MVLSLQLSESVHLQLMKTANIVLSICTTRRFSSPIFRNRNIFWCGQKQRWGNGQGCSKCPKLLSNSKNSKFAVKKRVGWAINSYMHFTFNIIVCKNGSHSISLNTIELHPNIHPDQSNQIFLHNCIRYIIWVVMILNWWSLIFACWIAFVTTRIARSRDKFP